MAITNSLDFLNKKIYQVNNLGTLTGGTDDIDLELGSTVLCTISTATQTFTFSGQNSEGNDYFVIFITNGGSQTINWPGSVDWVNSNAPILSASGVDALVFSTNDGGTTWYGFVAGRNLS